MTFLSEDAPAETASLADWRRFQHNAWGFRHIDRIVATRAIPAGEECALAAGPALDLAALTARIDGAPKPIRMFLPSTRLKG